MDLSGVWLDVNRRLGFAAHARLSLGDRRLHTARDLYKKDLYCHYGCVNAIEFSQDGAYMVSGGDDRRVVLWRFAHTLLEHGQPEQMPVQHFSNVFCLALTNDNSIVFSGGNDDQVIAHDTETKSVIEVLPHQKAVCGISIDSYDPHVLATAGNDGRLLVFDTRQSVEESLVVSRSRKAFHAVAFHPTQRGLLVAANARNGAALWDLRKPKHAIIKYDNGTSMSQNCMSVRFNRLGNRILALHRRCPPVLYALDSVEPLAHFYHPDYYNSCTMKSCTFAGEQDEFVLSGSDDFNVYMWKVPCATETTLVNKTHIVLYGHRSIVNQVRYNPHYCVIASSGVEKIIKLWSPFQIPGSKGSLTEELLGPDNPRDVYSHEDYVSLVHSSQYIMHHYGDRSTTEDPRMMALFDSLLQREIEGWSADETDSLSDDTAAPNMGSNIIGNQVRNTRPLPLGRNLRPPQLKDSDSSDSDQMLIHFLRKRIPNGIRNQRCQNRIARLIASRQSKFMRFAPKRMTSRNSKLHISNLTSTASSSKRLRAPRPLRGRRGLRRGGPSPPLPVPSGFINTTESPPTDSDPDSDVNPSTRSNNRNMSKMTRLNRRRMNTMRHFKKKNKAIVHHRGLSSRNECMGYSNDINSSNNNNLHNDDHLAIPSTSTGIRSHHSVTLFHLAEVDSDDDQSAGSCPKSPQSHGTDHQNLPLVNILPKPINGSRETINDALKWENNISSTQLGGNLSFNNNIEIENAAEEPFHIQNWNRPEATAYTPTLARLRNETNESEVESSCSTRSTADDARSSTPHKLVPQTVASLITTPDSGVLSMPCSSSSGNKNPQAGTNAANNSNECQEETSWISTKHRQRVKRARRNYRNRIGDSDST